MKLKASTINIILYIAFIFFFFNGTKYTAHLLGAGNDCHYSAEVNVFSREKKKDYSFYVNLLKNQFARASIIYTRD